MNWRRWLTWGFFGLVGWLLVTNAREIEWREVVTALRALPWSTLALAGAIGCVSYALYCCYDLLSRRYVGHRLPTGRVLATTFVSYAFNLNLGALVGGMGFRHRLYSRQGLSDAQIARIIGFSMWTNWLGYFALAGAVFAWFPPPVPAQWPIGSGLLRAAGIVLLAAVLAYLLACALSSRREFTIRGHVIALPSFRLACLQLLVAAGNWALIGLIVWTLLQFEAPYPLVLATLLAAAVAGVITHVPAGLGVLEAVFVLMIAGSDGVPKNALLGALLAYRALYYLTPLVIAALAYLALEARIAAGGNAGSRGAAADGTAVPGHEANAASGSGNPANGARIKAPSPAAAARS